MLFAFINLDMMKYLILKRVNLFFVRYLNINYNVYQNIYIRQMAVTSVLTTPTIFNNVKQVSAVG